MRPRRVQHSGKYDPIRSATMDNDMPDAPSTNGSPQTPAPERTVNPASASPSISSLIDPPHQANTYPHPFSRFVTTSSEIPAATAPDSSPSTIHVAQPSPTKPPTSTDKDVAPRRDSRTTAEPSTAVASKATKKASANSSSGGSPATASPKPARHKEAPPPPPAGSGLLSSLLFGGPTSAPAPGTGDNRPTIVLDVPLKRLEDRYINVAKLVEERYGLGALNARLGAQRERLARVAAAGAALERNLGTGSPDETSLDLSEPDSNVEQGGTEGSGDGGAKKTTKRKRKAKGDDYNKDDPFIDDSEMLWQQQAASSKDGFFVYEGPLVPPGEKPTIERYIGPIALVAA